MNRKRAVIYARASTGKQDERNQIPEVRNYIEFRGFEMGRIYKEKASAWKDGKQTEFSRLMKDAKNGEFDVLVVWALDRLTREGPVKMITIVNNLEEMGVSVISVQEASFTDVSPDLKPLILSIFGWMANQESKRISERTKAGIRRKRELENGKKAGRPVGSKDKKPRRTGGYKLRQARLRVQRAESGVL